MKNNIYLLKDEFDVLYNKYNNKKYIQCDPIKFLYRFEKNVEKELVGFISSALAFGRVSQIFRAVETFLEISEHEPYEYIMNLRSSPCKKLEKFKYRFVDANDFHKFLLVIKKILSNYGSLGDFAKSKYNGDIFEMVSRIIEEFRGVYYLVPRNITMSPCKRIFMFLRWMVRKDNIDIGCWDFIKTSDLIIPLDVHIYNVSRDKGLTSRKNPSFKMACEITENLKLICESDPVKYDWSLSHIEIIKNNFSNSKGIIPSV